MVKLTLKLVIVGLIANALFQVVPPFYTFWQFRDAMTELATYPGFRATAPMVLQKCEKIARDHGLDLTREDFTVKLATPGTAQTTTIDVSYEVVLKPIPGRAQAHLFTVHAVGEPPRFGALTP